MVSAGHGLCCFMVCLLQDNGFCLGFLQDSLVVEFSKSSLKLSKKKKLY